MTSQQLLTLLGHGDANALEALVVRHIDSLHGYLRLRCGEALRQHESCSDLVQSVCREALGEAGRFEYRGEAAFRHWLFVTAERKLADRARHWQRAKRDAGRIVPLPDSQAQSAAMACYASFCTPSQAAAARDEQARIERAFDQLDPAHREVILMSRVIGLTNEEIAERTGRTPHYTRTVLSRALARLSTLLDRGSE